MLEVLEQVAGEPELRRRDRVTARELEGERGLSVVEHEAVVVGQLARRLAGAQGRDLPVRADRQLEHVLAGGEPIAVTLADHAAGRVDEGERAADVVAEDRQQGGHAAAFEHGVGEPLVHLDRALDAGKLLVRELRRNCLRQRDERHLVGHRDEREVELLGLVGKRLRRLGPTEADPEREPGQSVSGEAADVFALRPSRARRRRAPS